MRTPRLAATAAVSVALLAACGAPRERERPKVADGLRVLATVNGVPITERDLEHASSRALAGGAPGHEDPSGNVLRTVVREELVYQRAVQLGLDRDDAYRLMLADVEAQLRAFQRKEMAGRYRQWVQAQAAVADADARDFYARNAGLIQTSFHVLQIRGKQAEVVADREAVRGGAAFEEVAARRFGGAPADARAWDLGELRWFQLPRSWRGVVERLEPGQVSEVIAGEGGRFWLVKLAARRVDPAVTFDAEKARIVEALRQEKAEALYARKLAELNERARVVYER